jgi:heme/copper-type cytochrome/quinol oxidase subunit 4
MVITGSIVLKNTDGYLSADLSKFKGIYIMFSLLYASLASLWYHLMSKNNDKINNLQKIVFIILMASFFESFMNMIYFFHLNHKNNKSDFLMVLIVATEVVRSTFSRIIVLFVALGY